MKGGDIAAALREDASGLRLDVLVSPGASASRFPDRFDPWRNRIGIRVQAAARDSRANREVVRLVARFFGCPDDAVRITKGAATSHKTLTVEGVTAAQALERLLGARP